MYKTEKETFFMPKIYLSPSAQEFNHYIDGGSEEYYMNLIADAMEPYLRASGIDFDRNQPEMTLGQIISDANAQDYGLHLAIHSNASPDAQSGKNTGVQIYYYPSSAKGKRFAEIIEGNYKPIYREPMNTRTVPSASLAELRRTKAPAVLMDPRQHRYHRARPREIGGAVLQSGIQRAVRQGTEFLCSVLFCVAFALLLRYNKKKT